MIFKAEHDPDNMIFDETKFKLFALQLAKEACARRDKRIQKMSNPSITD